MVDKVEENEGKYSKTVFIYIQVHGVKNWTDLDSNFKRLNELWCRLSISYWNPYIFVKTRSEELTNFKMSGRVSQFVDTYGTII